MANEVVVTIRVDDDGTLKVIAKEADKATKATKGLTQATKQASNAQGRAAKTSEQVIKGQKGVAGATSNGTKAFSKMNQGLGGSTGLVQSYAILASNVFAATAAFNALRRVAQVEQLAEGLQFVGNTLGRDLKGAAKTLTDITGSAVSMSQAMRTVAVGIAAGFKGEEIEGLAKVAKGASIALGRDMADALDRLVRGVAKLEPEILDELGILVRLDTAAEKYATTLGVSAESLSQFERQQAFLNDTLEQGTKKYGDIAAQIDPNPYDKLSAALTNLAVNIVSGLQTIFRLGDAIAFLSEHMWAMTGVVTTALIPLTKRLAPGMFTMATAAAAAAAETAELSKAELGNIKITEGMSVRVKEVISNVKTAAIGTGKYAEAQKTLTNSIESSARAYIRMEDKLDSIAKKRKAHIEQLDTSNMSSKKSRAILNALDKERDAELKKMKDINDRLGRYNQLKKDLLTTQRDELAASATSRRADAIALASRGNLIQATRQLNLAMKEYSMSLTVAATKTTFMTKVGNKLKVGMFALGGAAKAAGTAFLRFLPYLGLAVTAITSLISYIKEYGKTIEDEVKEKLKEASKSFANFTNIFEQFDRSSQTGGQRIVNAYIAWAGILDEISEKLITIQRTVASTVDTSILDMQVRIREIDQELKRLEGGGTPDVGWGTKLVAIFAGIKSGNNEAYATNAAINKLIEERAELEIGMNATRKEGAIATIGGQQRALEIAIEQLRARQKVATDGGILSIVGTQEIDKLQALSDRLTRVSFDNLNPEAAAKYAQILSDYVRRYMTEISLASSEVRQVFTSAEQQALKFNQEINKLQQKERGPYDNLIANVDKLVDAYKALANPRLGLDEKRVAELQKELKEGAFRALNLKEEFLEGMAGAQKLQMLLKTNNNIILESTKEYKKQLQVVKVLNAETKQVKAFEFERLKAAREANIILTKRKEADLSILIQILNEKGQKTSKEVMDLQSEINALKAGRLSMDEIALRTELKLLEVTKARNDMLTAQGEMIENQMTLMQKYSNLLSGRGFALTAEQDYEATIRSAELKVHAAELDYELTKARSTLELKVLELRLKALEAQGLIARGSADAATAAYKEQLDITEKIAKNKVRDSKLALAEVKLAGPGGAAGSSLAKQFGLDLGTSIVDAVSAGMSYFSNTIDASKELRLGELESQKSDYESVIANKRTPPIARMAFEKELQKVNEKIQEINEAGPNMFERLQVGFMSTALAIKPMLEDLSSLGPDGEVVTAAVQGALVIGEAWIGATRTIIDSLEIINNESATAKERFAAQMTAAMSVAEAMGASIAAISAMQNASSDARVAALEKEIDAEKKRDGKSAESLAKISALEKKAEREKRKQFEKDKKMKMAQVVMNTAAAIMGIWSGVSDPFFSTAAAAAMTAVVSALGALQLATIASTSYDGGGASAAPGGPTKIAVGERSNSIDVAKSRSPAGELAYMRGASGFGDQGATNYVPTFTGRATGGNTSYLVGEQGPELFIPDRPGTILPADKTEQVGNTANVTFNINAIDTQGMEEALQKQRGAMIRMFREAANANGEYFLENVNTFD